MIWERGRGFYTTPPFSEPEVFEFPEGIGPVECVNVEHEEVVLIPRWVDCERVTFKYGLGQEFIDVLSTLHKLGLDSTDSVSVRGVKVAPRDVVAAALPDPATLGERMSGRTCAGTWVTGTGKDGQPRSTYLYHVVDNETTMREYGSQAVVWQTAINPVVALELLDRGERGRGPACSVRRRSRRGRSSSCSTSTAHPTGRWSCLLPSAGRCSEVDLGRQDLLRRLLEYARGRGFGLAREELFEVGTRDDHDDRAENHAADAHPQR